MLFKFHNIFTCDVKLEFPWSLHEDSRQDPTSGKNGFCQQRWKVYMCQCHCNASTSLEEALPCNCRSLRHFWPQEATLPARNTATVMIIYLAITFSCCQDQEKQEMHGLLQPQPTQECCQIALYIAHFYVGREYYALSVGWSINHHHLVWQPRVYHHNGVWDGIWHGSHLV